MRLWIDGQCLQTPSRLRGIGRYVSELVRAIAEHRPDVELLMSFNAAMPDEALQAREAMSDFIDPNNIYVWHGATAVGEAIEGYTAERKLDELAIAHHVNCLAPDVALSASPFEGAYNPIVPLLPNTACNIPIASIFYDAIPYRYPDRYLSSSPMRAYYHRRLGFYSGFADNLCISRFSQSELESIHPGVRSENIAAGISKDFLEAEKKALSARGDHGKFILYVGALDWRKNVETLIRSFRHIDGILRDDGLKLIVAGDGPPVLVDQLRKSWSSEGLAADRLICLGHVSNEDLISLYRQAEVLVQPSFMEGFGLTALEAIHCGTPVVAARAGALPEVVGVDELLFDPSSAEDLARVLVRLLNDKPTTAGLMKQAQAHAECFTWQSGASLVVERLTTLVRRDAIHDLPGGRMRLAHMLGNRKMDHDGAARSLALAEPATQPSRLLIDVTSTVRVDHKTGIQRVVKNICAAISDPKHHLPSNIEKHLVYCDDDSGCHALGGDELRKPEKDASRPLAIGCDVLLMLDSSWEFHALHGHNLRACRLRGGQVVSCLYDTVPLRASAFCETGMPIVFSAWFRTALTYSTGFVCISRAVADELHAILEAISFPRRMKIGYWHLGADFAEAAPAGTEDGRDKARPMFLMVGTLEPRKGHRVALEAFERLWAAGVDADLVMVGKEGWGVEALAQQIRQHAEHGRRLTWHVDADDAMLAQMYRRCDALIAASFGEGFGLPVVEAGHFGKPVIASDIPVFHEVGEGAASVSFFEVGSAPALADAVKKFLVQPGDARSQASHTTWQSWRESAAQLEDVVLGGNWYKVYEPRERRDYAPLDDFGNTRMSAPLAPEQRRHALKLIEGPVPLDGGASLKITVAVTNCSSVVWSSEGSPDGSLGVNLGFRVVGRDGRIRASDNPRTPIPFVHIPGDTLYMPVIVPARWKRRGAAFVDIELEQKDVVGFGGALRVAL
ncbi:MAG: glycosyltransferase family 1 protein [Xanthobacteraceae bacterium]